MPVERWTDEMLDELASGVSQLRESVADVRDSVSELRESVADVRDSVDGLRVRVFQVKKCPIVIAFAERLVERRNDEAIA
jgi:uncharacterized protein YoxC